jgi:DNA-binding HxlR family transcriptional regulator
MDAGIVERIAYQTSPQRFEYHLTSSGEELAPSLKALLVWGLKHVVQPDDPTGTRTAMRGEAAAAAHRLHLFDTDDEVPA